MEMEIKTRRQVIKGVPERWAKQYSGPYLKNDAGKQAILRYLNTLDLDTCQPDDVDRIIGNSSWTDNRCDVCQENFETLIRIGQEPDYDARWLYLCSGCLAKAMVKIKHAA